MGKIRCTRRLNKFAVPPFLLGAVFPALLAANAQAADISSCRFAPVVVRQIDKKQGGVTTREVDTPKGKRAVSVQDGVRMLIEYPNGQLFANVKVERSPQASYSNDKMAIIAQLELMGGTVRDGLQRSRIEMLEMLSLSDSAENAPAGMYTFFDDRRSLVVTAYLFMQTQSPRLYEDAASYEKLRASFLQQLASCVAAAESNLQ